MSGQFGVSSSLLFPLHQVGKLDSGTIRCQFIIIIVSLTSSPALSQKSGSSSGVPGVTRPFQMRRLSPRGDNSVSVHHYCFPYIKSVSWIQGQFGVSSSLLLFPLHQVLGTIRCQFIIIIVSLTSSPALSQKSGSSSGVPRDNSVSVHHYYCFPYIKSWGQFGVSSSLLLFPLHQVLHFPRSRVARQASRASLGPSK